MEETQTIQKFPLNYFFNGSFYIFGEIDETILTNIIPNFLTETSHKANSLNPEPINIYINSGGGDLYIAWELITLIEHASRLGIPVVSHVYAKAASAASLIAISCPIRVVSERAAHIMHYARGGDFAHNPEMARRNLQYFEFLQEEILTLYKKHTKIDDVHKKLELDNYIIFGGGKLKQYGLADYVLGDDLEEDEGEKQIENQEETKPKKGRKPKKKES